MTSPAGLLDEVLRVVGEAAALPDEALLQRLRAGFSGVHFSLCRDDDMPARLSPVAESAVCRIYYAQSGDHCLSLTTDADAATGLVVALVDQDE